MEKSSWEIKAEEVEHLCVNCVNCLDDVNPYSQTYHRCKIAPIRDYVRGITQYLDCRDVRIQESMMNTCKYYKPKDISEVTK